MNSEYLIIGSIVVGLSAIIGIFQPGIKLLKSIYDAIDKNTKELIKINERNAYTGKIVDNHESRLNNHEERINKLEMKG